MPPTRGVTVGALLGSRPEAFGLPLDLLAGGGGLDRVITSPHIQKTGLAESVAVGDASVDDEHVVHGVSVVLQIGSEHGFHGVSGVRKK